MSAVEAVAPTPQLEALRGKVAVVKIGGNAMQDPNVIDGLAGDIAELVGYGALPVVVHGGGPQITRHLDRLGIRTEFARGLRVTTGEVLQAARMVLEGQLQRQLVNRLDGAGLRAVGVSGEDGHLMTAERSFADVEGHAVDVGLVGRVKRVDGTLVESLLRAGYVPVLSSIARGDDGDIYNVNADAAAAAVAVALDAEALVLLTDVPGICVDWPRNERVVASISAAELRTMAQSAAGGMAPKIDACLAAVSGGVARVKVADGRHPHGCMTALAGDAHGTTVTP